LLADLQRKVKFPTEFDALDLATDELKEKLLPVSRKLKEVEKERAERRKVRKRTKNVAPSTATAATGSTDVEMTDGGARASGSTAPTAVETTTQISTEDAGVEEGKGKDKAGGELEEEGVYREKELKELETLISPELKSDVGCSVTGLYDLVGQSFCLFPLHVSINLADSCSQQS
jgi:ubiquitin carboxyl-terminal hydrolase 14